MESCPTEDVDEDSYAAWEDCNDDDDTIHPYAGDTYDDGEDSDCDDLDCEATTSGDDYFAACPLSLGWEDADAACFAAGYDGLATVTSSDEQDAIETLMSPVDLGGGSAFYIGLSDVDSEGAWVWNSGDSSTYTNWDTGEPNGGTTENYAEIFEMSRSNGGKWNDSAGTGLRGAICEVR